MLTASDPRTPGRRRRLDPAPRFKKSRASQLDAIAGCPELQVPAKHLAWSVMEVVRKLDVSSVTSKSSSLGRHGFHPSQVLGVLVYASLNQVHEATKISALTETDAAYRLLSGGYKISGRTLRRFRAENTELFAAALEQTVALGHELQLVDPHGLAVDSVRLRAHASTGAVRTLERSQKRLIELAQVEIPSLDEKQRQEHEAKVRKHESAVAECVSRERTNIVTTNPSAGLMKFPNGGSAPGHRVTVTATGKKARFVVGVLVDAATTDFGKLEGAIREARKTLTSIGIPEDARLRVRADGGYWSREDLAFAKRTSDSVDVLIAAGPSESKTPKFFDRAAFKILENSVQCPAGSMMDGPFKDNHRVRWVGVGCSSCELKPKCTEGKKRSLFIDHEYDDVASAMRRRMTEPDAKELYSHRIATIEPVFSNIESSMGYRRATSRVERTIRAEILLKLLAHNISRLIAARRLVLVVFVLR